MKRGRGMSCEMGSSRARALGRRCPKVLVAAPPLLEHDVRDPVLGELVTGRKPSLTRAHDHDIDGVNHPRVSLTGCEASARSLATRSITARLVVGIGRRFGRHPGS